MAMAFHQANNMVNDENSSLDSDPGSTAVVAFLTAKQLTVANVGNSRAFICIAASNDQQVQPQHLFKC
jgi:serine/threonine protein phosphatase PrpC